MRDVVAGCLTVLALLFLASGGVTWYSEAFSTDPTPAGKGDVLQRAGAIFVRFWLASACFFGGALTLILQRRRGNVRVASLGTAPGCGACQQEPRATCVFCGTTYCVRHGGLRWCWASDPVDDGISLAHWPVCASCTPNSTRVGWSVVLSVLFMASVLLGLIYAWLNFPR